MTLNVCWSAKGGSGTTVVAAALALGSAVDSLLVDVDGELPTALGVPEPCGQGLSDWFASDAPDEAVLDLAVEIGGRTSLVPRAVGDPATRRGGRRCATSSAPRRWTSCRRRVRAAATCVGRRRRPQPAGDPGVLPVADPRRRLPRPDAVVLVAEPGRSLERPMSHSAVGAPVIARVAVDPAIAAGRRRRSACRQAPARDAQGAATAPGGRVNPADERLVAALCRAAQGEPGSAEAAVREHVRRLAPLAGAAERERLVGAAVARLDGLGPLDALLRDADVDEVLVNGGGEIWIERAGVLERSGSIGADDLATLIERILAPLGRRLDRTTPIVDARLGDGTRVCAVVPPISVDGTCLSLRRFRRQPLPLARVRRRGGRVGA